MYSYIRFVDYAREGEYVRTRVHIGPRADRYRTIYAGCAVSRDRNVSIYKTPELNLVPVIAAKFTAKGVTFRICSDIFGGATGFVLTEESKLELAKAICKDVVKYVTGEDMITKTIGEAVRLEAEVEKLQARLEKYDVVKDALRSILSD